MRIRTKAVLVGLLMAGLGGGAMAAAGEHVAKLRELADQKLRAVLLDASVIEAVKAQNMQIKAQQAQIEALQGRVKILKEGGPKHE